MSFSPRARPHTVNLAFSDPDLTDSYRDDRSFNTASSPRHRHPLGDSPYSTRHAHESIETQTTTSTGRYGSSRGSQVGEYDGDQVDSSERIKSNLDKLLDLLDQDDHEAQQSKEELAATSWERSGRSYMSTPPPLPPPAASTSAQPHYAPSSAPPTVTSSRRNLDRQADYSTRKGVETPFSDTTRATPTAGAGYSTGRPPLSARGSSALELLQRANGFSSPHAGPRIPVSPSPRPGSVAAMRRNDGETSRTGPSSGAAAAAAPAGADESSTAGLMSGLSRMAVNGDASSMDAARHEEADRRSNASLDSIARVAEAALQEFDDIVSDTTHPDGRRPASRLRSASTPPHSAATTRIYAATEPTMTQSHATVLPAGSVNEQLVEELHEAQDYIAYLQEELRAISEVVVQLREQPSVDSRTATAAGRGTSPRRKPPATSQDWIATAQSSTESAFQVMQHTFAMLPSLTDHSAPIDSVARALAFVRRMDDIVRPRGLDRRRDEDVFAPENLNTMADTVQRWASQPA